MGNSVDTLQCNQKYLVMLTGKDIVDFYLVKAVIVEAEEQYWVKVRIMKFPLNINMLAAQQRVLTFKTRLQCGDNPIELAIIEAIVKLRVMYEMRLDEVKILLNDQMIKQLKDTSDIVIPNELAPRTKKLMKIYDEFSKNKPLTTPAKPMPSKVLSKMYRRSLERMEVEVEDASSYDSEDL